jgi:hypothetical protein
MKSTTFAFQKALICCFIFLFAGCAEHGKKNHPSKVATKEHTESSRNALFPIDFIIQHAQKRKVKYVIKKMTSGECVQITPAFFQKHLNHLPVKNQKNKHLNYDPYARYYFFDCVKSKEVVRFTIIYSNEDGYDAYYHCTYDQKNDKVNDVILIAVVGGDGGYDQHETLLYSDAFTRLHVKTEEIYDEFLDDKRYQNCFSRTTNISDTKFHFERTGTTFKRKANKKTSCDTICE